MKLSVSAWCVQKELFSGRMDLYDFVELCSIKSVQYVELLDCFFRDSDHIGATLEHLENKGIAVSAFSIANDFVQSAEKREAEIEKVFKGVDTAVRLGAKYLRVFSGEQKEGVSYSESQEIIVESLIRCSEYAGQKGSTLVLENHGLLAGRSLQVKQIIEEVNSTSLRANFDTGNFLLVNERPSDAVELLSDLIGYVHIKDLRRAHDKAGYHAVDGSVFEGTEIGCGDVDIPAVISALTAKKYNGFLSIEYEGEENQIVGTRNSIDFMKTIMRNTSLERIIRT